MKILVTTVLALLFTHFSYSQSTVPALDKSPMDVSYCPANYPLLKVQDKITDPLVARVIYSRPQIDGRVIFGNLLEYGKVWRLGANEATEIEFFQNVVINNRKIKKGKYTLYAILQPDNWTIILNRELDTWGSFGYDSTKDVLRVTLPVQKQTDSTEVFSMYFDKSGKGYILNTIWENVKVSLPILLP
ncbi:MAG: DUF2911 domain-containing protein [Bacteroidetes bacterium]|nr:DUF2911 domain-containing protein [Bacteroidota bacterium]MBS1755816.1 DUF2911 domain-containing protein [Bacteroidota bacterium]